jgi:hypothetical protein
MLDIPGLPPLVESSTLIPSALYVPYAAEFVEAGPEDALTAALSDPGWISQDAVVTVGELSRDENGRLAPLSETPAWSDYYPQLLRDSARSGTATTWTSPVESPTDPAAAYPVDEVSDGVVAELQKQGGHDLENPVSNDGSLFQRACGIALKSMAVAGVFFLGRRENDDSQES